MYVLDHVLFVVAYFCTLLEEPGDESDSDGKAPMFWKKWNDASVVIRYQLSMPADRYPWISEHKLEAVPKGLRHLDIISVAYWAYVKQARERGEEILESPRWVVDISQSIERKPWGPFPQMNGQKTQNYMFDFDRVQDAEDRRRNVVEIK